MNQKSAKGQVPYSNYLKNGINTPTQAIHAKCYECMYEYRDGKVDCKLKKCPLYPWMPYREKPIAEEKKSHTQMKLPFL